MKRMQSQNHARCVPRQPANADCLGHCAELLHKGDAQCAETRFWEIQAGHACCVCEVLSGSKVEAGCQTCWSSDLSQICVLPLAEQTAKRVASSLYAAICTLISPGIALCLMAAMPNGATSICTVSRQALRRLQVQMSKTHGLLAPNEPDLDCIQAFNRVTG